MSLGVKENLTQEELDEATKAAIAYLQKECSAGFVLIGFKDKTTMVHVASTPENIGAALSDLQATVVSLPEPYRQAAMSGFVMKSKWNQKQIQKNAEAIQAAAFAAAAGGSPDTKQ